MSLELSDSDQIVV